MDFVGKMPTIARPNTLSSQSQPITSGKMDLACSHCLEGSVSNKNVKCLTCFYRRKKIQGGGINQFKQHFVGVKGEICPCPKVEPQVRYEMQNNLQDVSNKKRSLQNRLKASDMYNQSSRQSEE